VGERDQDEGEPRSENALIPLPRRGGEGRVRGLFEGKS
jgi:hypothetical protein